MSSFPFIFTFYSYKGGVGRSMAVLNCAYALAGRGRHVLVIDMDLEAPGLSEFLQYDEGETQGSPEFDAIDLVTWARDLARAAGSAVRTPDFQLPAPPNPSAYIRWAPNKELEKVRPRLGWLGRLDFISVRQRGDYLKRLERLELSALSREELNRTGVVLRRWLKEARLQFTFPGLEAIEGPRQVPYDYVLIDSRTGITEIGGLCVGPLSDRLVVLTALNDQNIRGTAWFLKEIGAHKPRNESKEPWDSADVAPDAPEAPNRLGPKPTLVVASLLPAGELEYRQRRLGQVQEHIGRPAARLSYHPRMAVQETIFTRDWRGEYLGREYAELADALMGSVDDHAAQLARRSQKSWNEEKRRVDAIHDVVRLLPHMPDLGEQLLRQLGDMFDPENPEQFAAAYRLYACLSQETAADREIALHNFGNALSDQAKTKQDAEGDRLFEQAYAKYAEAMRIKPDFHEALNNWGAALLFQAAKAEPGKAGALLDQAEEKLRRAEELKPGVGSYNLACVAARRGRADECKEWLDRCNEYGKLPTRTHIENDPDFESVGNEPWFRELVEALSK